jgi:hypothetical protein
MRSSITELSFHGIPLPPPSRGKSVTHVSGTFCYLCVEPHTINGFLLQIASMLNAIGEAGAADVVFDEGGTIPETVICHCEDDNT